MRLCTSLTDTYSGTLGQTTYQHEAHAAQWLLAFRLCTNMADASD